MTPSYFIFLIPGINLTFVSIKLKQIPFKSY